MAQGLIGLPAILAALRFGGTPGQRPTFSPLAGLEEFLNSGSGDLLGPVFFGLQMGAEPPNRSIGDGRLLENRVDQLRGNR